MTNIEAAETMKAVEEARTEMAQIAFDLGTFHGKLVMDMDLLRDSVAAVEKRVEALERRFDKFVFGDLLLKKSGRDEGG
jgi:hypothetical protein